MELAFWTRHFQAPWLLPLALVLPALFAGLVLAWGRARARRVRRLGEPALVARLTPLGDTAGGRWRAARLGLAGLLAGIALAGPRWGLERQVVRTSGIDVVLALDASLSMLAEDERPSRLTRMKQEVRRLRALSPGDRTALVAFAGRSYILTPLTTDAGAIELFLDNLEPSVVGQAGSSLARAIRQATELLQASPSSGDRAIVVMSDGEAFEPVEDVAAAAAEAAAANLAVVTVGFGTEGGATIPVREANTVREKRDSEGNVVVTRYTPATLRAAAEAARGTFIPADAADKASRVRAALANLRGRSRTVDAGRDLTPRFQLFLAPAFALLLLDSWRAGRGARGRRRRATAPGSAGGATVRAAAAAVMVVALGASGCGRLDLPGRDRDAALDAFRRGDARAALATYRDRTRAGGSVTARYNLGTALAAVDSIDDARAPLDEARRARDAELRFRALFNLGYTHLRRGLAGRGGADANAGGQVAPDSAAAGGGRDELDAALATYRQALLVRPADLDAKWNYELALRRQPPSGGGGGGGGGGGAGDPPPEAPPQPAGGVDRRQAEQLLNAAAREERQTQAKQQRPTPPPPPPGGKDW
jgi:Ca-activated chloride channel family protein